MSQLDYMLIRLSSRRRILQPLLFHRGVGNYKKFENPVTKRRFERVATLKYDPCQDEDFTAYGIVPFFQKRLNDMLLPKSARSGSIPRYNIKPSDDQRKLLSILKSDHSVVLKGGVQTGKSLSLITYALDAVLSRTPNYKLIRLTGLDSVIIVPTDELVDTYKKYVAGLLRGIHPECCPDELIPNKTTKEFELTRKPLRVEFLSTKKSEVYSTDGESGTPQVLVTTLSRLSDIINGEGESLTKINLLENIKLLAVDETDIFTQTSQLGHVTLVGTQGPKKKYFSKLDLTLRKLQSQHIDSFRNDLIKRLNRTAGRKEHGESASEGNTNIARFVDNSKEPKFNYTQFILSHNDLSTSNIEEHVSSHIGPAPDIELLKKMIRQRRKVLYKPIQFCFIYQAPPPYKEMLNVRASITANLSLNQAVKQQGQIIPLKSNEALHDVYTTYLHEKRKELDSRDEDTTINYVQKIIRFSDDQRLLREKERRLISAGGYDSENKGIREAKDEPESEEELTAPVNVFFPYISTKGRKLDLSVGELDVTSNYPNDIKTMELMEEHVRTTRNNVKNMEKVYIKTKLESRDIEKSQVQIKLNKSLKRSKIKVPSLNRRALRMLEKLFLNIRVQHNLKGSVLVVVPGDVNPEIVAKDLSGQKKFKQLVPDKFVHKEEQASEIKETEATTESVNLIVTPSQLVGQAIHYSNVIILGIEPLLPQLAYGSGAEIASVSGALDPYNDLMRFYLTKLQLAQSKFEGPTSTTSSPEPVPKNIFYVVDGTSSTIQQDLTRFGDMIMYNKMLDGVEVKETVLDPQLRARKVSVLEYGKRQ